MNFPRPLLPALLIGMFLLCGPDLQADSGTWFVNPVDNNWLSAANWSSGTVPNGSNDVATFESSAITEVSIPSTTFSGGIIFNPGASAYTITNEASNIGGFWFWASIVNNSGVPQNFVLPRNESGQASYFAFLDGVSVGSMVTFTSEAPGILEFLSFPGGGEGTFINKGAVVAGQQAAVTGFYFDATAGNSTIINEGATVAGAEGDTRPLPSGVRALATPP
jgi:hypothetical protein